MNKKNPIIYIGGPPYTAEHFSPILVGMQGHFEEIISSLPARNRDGGDVSVSLKVDDFNPEKVEAYAKRPSRSAPEYKVYLGGGFAHYIWTASRFIETDYPFFSWLSSVKLSANMRKKGRKSALADFAFYLLSYHTLLHELAHVYLGHCDFLQKEFQFEQLNEFDGYRRKPTQEEQEVIVALEADADRQAGDWLMGFLHDAQGTMWRGKDVAFPSKPAFFEFFVYVLTVGQVLNQQLTARADTTHPSPNQRQYIAISSAHSYLKKFCPADEEIISPKLTAYAVEAATKLGLLGLQSLQELIQTSLSMTPVDDVLKRIEVRKYQHTFDEIINDVPEPVGA